jgi:hypothetical protein
MSFRRLAVLLLAVFALQASGTALAAAATPCCPEMARAGDDAPPAPCGSLSILTCCETGAAGSVPESAAPAGSGLASAVMRAPLPGAEARRPARTTSDSAASIRSLRSTILRL